jgi:hypothetical protein
MVDHNSRDIFILLAQPSDFLGATQKQKTREGRSNGRRAEKERYSAPRFKATGMIHGVPSYSVGALERETLCDHSADEKYETYAQDQR